MTENKRLLTPEETANHYRDLTVLKAQDLKTRQAIYEWGNEPCPNHPDKIRGSYYSRKRECKYCWNELRADIKNGKA